MKRRNRRKPFRNNRERKENVTGLTQEKRHALDQLFHGMSPDEIIEELNSTWIDCRYKLVVDQREEELFKGWEVFHV